MQHEISNVAKVCGLPGFRYFVFAPLSIAPRQAVAPVPDAAAEAAAEPEAGIVGARPADPTPVAVPAPLLPEALSVAAVESPPQANPAPATLPAPAVAPLRPAPVFSLLVDVAEATGPGQQPGPGTAAKAARPFPSRRTTPLRSPVSQAAAAEGRAPFPLLADIAAEIDRSRNHTTPSRTP